MALVRLHTHKHHKALRIPLPHSAIIPILCVGGVLATALFALYGLENPLLFACILVIVTLVASNLGLRSQIRLLSLQAFHDPLTGTANRDLFRDRLEQSLMCSVRSNNHVSVLFCDLDSFKVVNDTFGHETGDVILIDVARRLQACLRPSDTLARYGGDEFVMLIEGAVDEGDIRMIIERIRSVFNEPFTAHGCDLAIAISVGMARGIGGRTTCDRLIAEADMDMYLSKRTSRSRMHDLPVSLDLAV